MKRLALIALPLLALGACTMADARRLVVAGGPVAAEIAQEKIAALSGMTPQEQCTALNLIRTLYPAKLAAAVDAIGTPDYICGGPDGEVLIAPAA